MKSGKQKLLFVFMVMSALAMIGFAGDERRPVTSERTDQDIPRPEAVGTPHYSEGDQVPPQLPPEFEALERPYREEISMLAAQLTDNLSEDEQQAIQEQIMALKHELKLARLNLALEQVRALGDTEAEARITASIQHLQNPTSKRAAKPTARDPETGEEITGGAR